MRRTLDCAARAGDARRPRPPAGAARREPRRRRRAPALDLQRGAPRQRGRSARVPRGRPAAPPRHGHRGGEPRVAPVDGLFFRGALHFGTAPGAIRARHIRARPQVSGSIAHGEEFAIVVHGRAVELDLDADEHEALRAFFTAIYGDGWESFRQGNVYWRLEADRMFSFRGVAQ